MAPTTGKSGRACFTIPPGEATLITLKTIPGAECTLCADGEHDPARSMSLRPDRHGVVRFHVRPDKNQSDAVKKLVVHCTLNGQTTNFPLELRVSCQQTPEMPPPVDAGTTPPQGMQVLPALTEHEASHLADAELL